MKPLKATFKYKGEKFSRQVILNSKGQTVCFFCLKPNTDIFYVDGHCHKKCWDKYSNKRFRIKRLVNKIISNVWQT